MSVVLASIAAMEDVFIGSEALELGALTRGQLRWNYQAIYPDVYAAKSLRLNPRQYAVGAWLWSRRRGVIAGIAAAARHGARWFDESAPVELIWRCGRPPPGVVVRNERIRADEIIDIEGIPVTTPERTALDIARHFPRDSAVSHLDALAQATGISTSDVWPWVDRYRGARGTARAVVALTLMDGGSASSRQTAVRLALIDSGLPRPKTRIKVSDEDATSLIDVGYEVPRVGIVFGDRTPHLFERAGWAIISALSSQPPRLIAQMVIAVIIERGYALSTLHRRL